MPQPDAHRHHKREGQYGGFVQVCVVLGSKLHMACGGMRGRGSSAACRLAPPPYLHACCCSDLAALQPLLRMSPRL